MQRGPLRSCRCSLWRFRTHALELFCSHQRRHGPVAKSLALRSGSSGVPCRHHFLGKCYSFALAFPDKFTIELCHSPKHGEPFAFGGVWDAWKEPDGGWLQSFAIIATDPNELTATVHNRMPVVLRPSEYDRWFSRADPKRPPVDLLRPYDADQMMAPRIGNLLVVPTGISAS
jgi:hypothetical protein